MRTAPARLTPADSGLLIIDVQEKLLPLIPGVPRLLLNLSFLLDAARILGVPTMATEQYPKGLGPTHKSLLDRLPAELPDKVVFSCAIPEIIDSFATRSSLVLAGIEAHVCVMQSALDMIARDKKVFVVADAVASRDTFDRDIALRRLEANGATLVTVETVAFEWLGTSASPAFKSISALVQERTRKLHEISLSG